MTNVLSITHDSAPLSETNTFALEIKHLTVNYGAVEALKDVSLFINHGEIVTLIGANGAGKSTILRSISRLIPVRSGHIHLKDVSLLNKRADQVVRLGVAHVPEGRRVLARMTVYDNLFLGAYTRNDHRAVENDIQRQFDRFPRLAERRNQLAGTLSGGEQQMLAIARGLMIHPRLLLLDEPSCSDPKKLDTKEPMLILALVLAAASTSVPQIQQA